MKFPKRVILELTNKCNRSCLNCPRHKSRYPLGEMSWQLFTKRVGEIPSNTTVVPFFRGESLIHSQFDNMMEELERFETVQLATNGDYLHQHERAILNNVTFFSLSLHNLQLKPTVYQHQFLAVARDLGITTQVSIVDSQLPLDKKEKFVDVWLDSVERVRIYREHSHSGFGDVASSPEVDVCLPCEKPFSEMAVYWDGKVALCNHDWDNREPLGDLNEQSIEEVWNGLAYRGLRELNLEGQRGHVGSCKVCDHWKTGYLPSKMFGELYERRT